MHAWARPRHLRPETPARSLGPPRSPRTSLAAAAAAAAADALNNDVSSSLPASYPLPNIISVASSTSADRRSCFSNYGASSVHLAAPGSSILSTGFGSDVNYVTYSGTSMATPIVSGAAALLFSLVPTATAAQVK